jgi:hypothetical protein
MHRMCRGIVGLLKWILHIDRASKLIIMNRRGYCETCHYRDGDVCEVCGCFLFPKTSIASEHCPLGVW